MIESVNPADDLLKQQRIDEMIVHAEEITPEMIPVLESIAERVGKRHADQMKEIKQDNERRERVLRTNCVIDDGIVHHDKKTPEITGKPSTITDKWLEETPEAYQARKMDIVTAFRKMNGFG